MISVGRASKSPILEGEAELSPRKLCFSGVGHCRMDNVFGETEVESSFGSVQGATRSEGEIRP